MTRTARGRKILAGIAVVALAGLVTACAGRSSAGSLPGAHASRGPALIAHYGCNTCHTIGGVQDANGTVGPDLRNFARQRYIVGLLPRTPINVVKWVMDAQKYLPGGVMPNLHVTERDAKDIAAYLYTQ